MSQLESYAAFDAWTGFKELPDVGAIVSRLEAHLPQSFVPGIIHGDCHIGNTMYHHDSAELAALVDWELATIGDPLIDLGWVMATWADSDHHSPVVEKMQPWEGFPSIDELVAHFGEHSGPIWMLSLGTVFWAALSREQFWREPMPERVKEKLLKKSATGCTRTPSHCLSARTD